MTDGGGCGGQIGKPEARAHTGNSLIMPGGSFDWDHILHALADGSLDAAMVRLPGAAAVAGGGRARNFERRGITL